MIFLGLVVLAAILMNLDAGSGSDLDELRFTIENTDVLSRITITGKDHAIDLERQSGIWMLNEQYQGDHYLIELMLSLLNRIRVDQAVAKVNVPGVMELINTTGVQVQLYQEDRIVGKFKVAGDQDQRRTYFLKEQETQPFLVRIPGYNDYLAPIFGLKTIQWRNRLVFNSSWRSVKRVEVTFPGQPKANFEIFYRENFLEIADLHRLDTTKMMTYLQIFEQFPTEGFIDPADYPQYQTLVQNSAPIIQIELEDINANRNNQLELYPKLEGDPYYLGMVGDKDMALFNPSKIEPLMASKIDFARR